MPNPIAHTKNMTTADVVEPAISSDPLLLNADLPLQRVYHPLGFSLELITNSDEVLAAADESWGGRRRMFSQPLLQLCVLSGEVGAGPCPPAPVYRGQRNLQSIVADARNFAVCDRDQGFASAWISGDAAAQRSYLRYHFLEPLALSMLSSSYVIPLHAACVELNGKGVLLCGNSGAGKSSLAFACARAGWNYISDDASYLVREGSGRLVAGNSQQVRLRPSAVELFPEVRQFGLAPRVAGKPSIEISTKLLPYVETASHCRVEHIIFLNRSASVGSELTPFPRELAMQWASQSLVATGDNDEARAASLRILLNAELWELHYSRMGGAVDCLESLINGR